MQEKEGGIEDVVPLPSEDIGGASPIIENAANVKGTETRET